MPWITPKTNWIAADGVANTDLNRIEGNTLDLDTRVKTWENFKANGGTIGGDITSKDGGNGGKILASQFRRKIKSNKIEHGYSAGFGIESADGSESIVLSVGNNSGIKTVMPIENGTYNLGDASYRWKSLMVKEVNVSGELWIEGQHIGTNGYTRLPNRMIMQWGTLEIAGPVHGQFYRWVFPVRFPTAILRILPTFGGIDTNTNPRNVYASGPGFQDLGWSDIRLGIEPGTSAAVINFIAIGY